jgi:glyoxylase-like metal-dependent hydrolase (beta-lactamase superfamily II)
MTQLAQIDTVAPGLTASPPEPLPFAPTLHIRAFVLERAAGNLLVYSTTTAGGDVWRQYLNHGHEAAFASDAVKAPLFVHAADRAAVEQTRDVRAAFSRRHMLDDDFEVIPTPGHTPGATAYVWEHEGRRFLFTGDTVYLRHGEWVAAVLDSSDRGAYLESLSLLRDLDFDVLVPWAASAEGPFYAATDRADTRRRIGAIIDRIWRGADR